MTDSHSNKITPLKNDLNLAVIGNCSFAALVNRRARINWACLPHFDGDPVFCSLVDDNGKDDPEYGFWDIELVNLVKHEQHYIPNTAVLETILTDEDGNAIKITDFAPRYMHYGRRYKPSTICRIVEPLSGSPRAKIRLRPRFNYVETAPRVTRGGNHIRYTSADLTLRLTTDAPATYILNETTFIIDKKYTFFFGPDEPLRQTIDVSGVRFLEETENYWREFVRSLALPFEYQDALIRSAITLKLCTFEETGAVLAALTSSIPEAPGSKRNWDYRYCWIRDSLFVINALNRLSTTRTMEDYIHFIMNASMIDEAKDLQPLYGISLEHIIEEYESEALKGYRGMGPVRFGNQAYVQQQNDVWGAVILAVTQAFFDHRLTRPGTLEDFYRLEKFGESALKNWDKPDAGIWEFRTFGRVHTFSAVMCWVALDRLAMIAEKLNLAERAEFWRSHADDVHAQIMERAWNEDLQSFVEPLDGDDVDASLLLLHELKFIDGKDPKFVSTVKHIEKTLMQDGLLYRYVSEDDFGKAEVAFTVCTFWFIDALAATGETEQARRHFEWLLSKRNHVGLLSEDMDFETHELWGNFPQTYSLVGLINSAMLLSKTWRDAI